MRALIEKSNEEVALGLNEAVVGTLITQSGGKARFQKSYQVLNVPTESGERRIIVADIDKDMKEIDGPVIFGRSVIGDGYVVIRENGMIGREL